MSERNRRGSLLVAIAVLTVGLLSACVSVPTAGTVNQGLAITGDSGNTSFEYNPDGPVAGATQQSILKGFVAAFTSSTGGYAVARQFLAKDFAAKWDPRQSVQVRSGAPRLTQLDPSTVQYSFSTIASVDSTGVYREGSQSIALTFSFVQEHKQWRISAVPDGIVLTDQIFQRVFAPHALYFLDSGNQHLIPDLRWFPSGTSAATRIVTALLAGPPDWLKGVAFSKFPDGTQLSEDGSIVTVDSGVAKVDLNKEASAGTVDLRDQEYMKLQLSESLSSVSNISSVQISVAGTPLVIPDLGTDTPQSDNKVDSLALVLRKSEFGYYATTNNRIAPLSGISSKVVALDPQAATLSSDGDTVALKGTGGVAVVRRAAAAAVVDTRDNLIAPSLDEYGYVWSVPTDDPNAIRAFDSAGVGHDVKPSLPSDAHIVSLEVSRDGARVTILLSTSTGPRLLVAGILRDPDQKQVPLSLGTPVVDVPLDEGIAIGTTWVDDVTVATLTTADGQSDVQLFTVGGQRSSLGTLKPAREIVGGNGQEGLRVLGNDSAIWTYGGSSWQSGKAKVDLIAVQR
ncbi:MAG TPA: LpqB family beta-propeller domain-containing protein [Lacisediminihabitans sp.]|uniref:LpqB family beta-propeller domain-containing protein n=1 Tax=Lacisediminihabitans sp. TaxID=2787631 RepID=UPI002ED9502F